MTAEEVKQARDLILRRESLADIARKFQESKTKEVKKGEPPEPKPAIVLGLEYWNSAGRYTSPRVLLDEELYDKIVQFVETITEAELLKLGVTK